MHYKELNLSYTILAHYIKAHANPHAGSDSYLHKCDLIIALPNIF